MTWAASLVAAAAVLGLLQKRTLPWSLAVLAGIPYTVAVVVGGNGVIPFFLLAIPLAAFAVFKHLTRPAGSKWRGPGVVPLMCFAFYSLLITAVGPVLFAGMPVLMPRGGTDSEVYNPSELEFTISHAAQVGYLVLGLLTVLWLASREKLSPRLPAAAFWTGLALSLAVYVTGTGSDNPLRKLFANSPNVRYINLGSDGETARFAGIFAEPASLGLFALTGLAFFMLSAVETAGRVRLVNLLGAALAAFTIYVGATGTALIGGLIVIAFGGVAVVVPFVAGRSRWHPGVVIAGMIFLVAAVANMDRIVGYASTIINGKIGSQSYDVRTASNEFSIGLLFDSFGLGVGLGSSKPNSFFTMLLSCVGIIGTLLFVVAMIQLIVAAWKTPEFRPAAGALLAFFLIKAVSGSTMSSPIMFILIGVCAYTAWKTAGGEPANLAHSPHRRPGRRALPIR